MGSLGTVRPGLAVLIVGLTLVACTDPKTPPPKITDSTIIVGVSDDAPGFSDGSHNPAGFDIDLMNAIGNELHTAVTPTIVAAADRPGYLMGPKPKATVIIAAYSITQARNQAGIDFAGPYLVSPQALLVRADDKRIVNVGDVVNRSVCTVGTTTGATVDIPGANMSTKLPTSHACADLLAQGGTDAFFDDTLLLYGYIHAFPGKFRLVLSGAFGELQYYGVGLPGGRHADCLTLNGVIKNYLRTQWRHDFLDTLPDAVAAYPGTDSSGDFESHFKPKDSDMTTLSCKL